MSALAVDEGRTLAEYARLRELVRDMSYLNTPIGRLIARYLSELRFDSYSDRTVDERERILAKLAVYLAHLEAGQVEHDHLRAFLSEHWRDAARNTKATNTSHVRAFFAWSEENGHIPADPARRLKAPRSQDTERVSHSQKLVRTLVAAQPSLRDRCGILLLYWCALRRNELRLVQYRHIDLANRKLTVFGKGSTVMDQNIPEPLALELERLMQREDPAPEHFLLHPQRVGRYGAYPAYTQDIIWQNPAKPYEISGIDRWWQRCVKKAGLPHFPMHELRHTAGTHFHEEGRDLVATQHFMRHANPAVTARTYIHLDRIRAVADVQRRMADPMADTP